MLTTFNFSSNSNVIGKKMGKKRNKLQKQYQISAQQKSEPLLTKQGVKT
jgi:hypothetical protein